MILSLKILNILNKCESVANSVRMRGGGVSSLIFATFLFSLVFLCKLDSKVIDSNNLQNLGFKVADSAKTHIDTSPFVSQKAQYDGEKTAKNESINTESKTDSIISRIDTSPFASQIAQYDDRNTRIDTSSLSQYDGLIAINDKELVFKNNNTNIESKKDSIKSKIDTSPFASQKAQYDDRNTRIDTLSLSQYDGLIAINDKDSKSNDKNIESKLADSTDSTNANIVTSQKAQYDGVETTKDENTESKNIDSIDSKEQNQDSKDSKANIESIDDDDAIVFDEINVSATKLTENEKPFNTAGAVSSRGNVIDSTQNLDQIIRSIPGTFTQVDPSQGTISVNIRNMTGLGRVNTEIDGVTQTFFGSSEDQGRYHSGGKLLGTSAFGAAIDQNLIVGIDVERGSFSGGRSNQLAGSANLRTIGVDDIMRDSKHFGVIGKFGYGDNKVGPNWMVGVAGKHKFQNDFIIGAMYAYSGRYTQQGYKIGGGRNPFEDAGSNPTDDGVPQGAAYNPTHLTQQPHNHLAKIEMQYHANSMLLSYRRYDNHLAGRVISQDNYQATYRFNPESKFIDINALVAYGNSAQIYDESAVFMWGPVGKMQGKAYNNAITFDINNTLLLPITQNLSYGARFGYKYFYNSYDKDMDYSYADENCPGGYCSDTGDQTYYFTYGFQPEGVQQLHTLYLDNSLKYRIYTLNANVNYVHWNLSTDRSAPCRPTNIHCEPKEAGFWQKSGDNVNVSAMFSANIHTLFTPFISYSLTSRIPNVQEMFFSAWGNAFQDFNTYLKPEVAQSYQAGFNSFKQGLITSDDSFGFKTTAFYTDIKDYIYNHTIGDPKDQLNGAWAWYFISSNGFASMYGLESELHYDMGYFYARLSYTIQRANLIVSEAEANIGGGDSNSQLVNHGGQGQFSQLPEDYGNFDLGFRLFNRKVVIGAVIKYTGRTKRLSPISNPQFDYNNAQQGQNLFNITTEYLPRIPTIVDLYVNFYLHKNLDLKLEVQNLMDENYIDALYAYNSSFASNPIGAGIGVTLFNNSARGRTFIASMVLRW